MGLILLIFGMGLCTFLPRYLPLIIARNKELPPAAKAMMAYVPPAVLAAIVVPALLNPTGNRIDLHPSSPYLVGGAVAMILTMCSKKMLISSFAAIVVFFLLQHILR